jgi:hypothetical protein
VTPRELVNKSTEPLKEIIAFPGLKKANEYLKLNYFNTGDNIYNTYVAVETEVTALNKKYLYYGFIIVLFTGIGIVIIAIISITKLDNLIYCSLILLGALTLIFVGITRKKSSKLTEYFERRNLEINRFGLCLDFTQT